MLAHTYDGWVGQALAARSIWRRAATRSLPRSAAPSRATAVRVTAAESTTGTPVGCAGGDARRRRCQEQDRDGPEAMGAHDVERVWESGEGGEAGCEE